MNKIKYIGFDADDTLWVNEPLFQNTAKKYVKLLREYSNHDDINNELFKTEMNNLRLYGFGVKSFTLSMIENALRVTGNKVPQSVIMQIIEFGKEILDSPVELIDGIEETLKSLSKNYKLIVATKGDLLDQERKLEKSGLTDYFHHIEVMSDKKKEDYSKLLKHLEINAEEFLMIGNSLKSDILPLLELGSEAIYIPFHTTWAHEIVDENELENDKFHKVEKVSEVIKIIKTLQ